MTYEEALAYLHGLQRFGIKPGLGRTRELLRRVGNPDQRCGRIIHITGTSGKGSVAAMVESALRAAGYRVGLYTSPSLERYTDRIQVNRQEISEAELAELVTQVAPHVSAMLAEGMEQVTEFEFATVVAFLYYERKHVDWLVLEVGLGGRFDATNAISAAAITCITNIGLDHTNILGTTHEAIAHDKAGIMKPGVPCITGATHPGALDVIRAEAMANTADLSEVRAGDSEVVRFGPEGQVVNLLGARGWYRDVNLSLLGRHQAENAAIAVRLLELAGLPEPAIRAGLAQVVWPGRFEILPLPGGGTALLDAAHNPAKCQALAEAVAEYFPGRPVFLVLGVLADKDVAQMIRPLLAIATKTWVATPKSPRQMPAEELARTCEAAGYAVTVEPSVARAVDQATAIAGPDGLLLVTGSFYTVGPARTHLTVKSGQGE